jgi:hypothetical protein
MSIVLEHFALESAIVGQEMCVLRYRKYYRVLFAIKGEIVAAVHET